MKRTGCWELSRLNGKKDDTVDAIISLCEELLAESMIERRVFVPLLVRMLRMFISQWSYLNG